MLVSVIEPGAHVELSRGVLQCVRDGAVLRRLRPHQVDALHLHGSATLSAGARSVLLREGVDVVFLTRDGRFIGRLVGHVAPGGERRVDQIRTVLDTDRRLSLARGFVLGKLSNQRALLMGRRLGAESSPVRGLDTATRVALEAMSLDALRGAEGAGARAYFGGLRQVVGPIEMRFERRTRRPPTDPVNAMLSYGYTLLVARVEHAMRRVALDPYIGILHETGRGAPCLALDLAEEWRPLVDAVVLRIVNRRQVTPDDFRTPLPEEVGVEDDVGAVWMGRVAKTILVRTWERRLRDLFPHPSTGDKWPALALMEQQALQLVRVLASSEPRWCAVELGVR